MSIEKSRIIVENAFSPLRCVAELSDFNNRLGFRVYAANGNQLVTIEDIVHDQAIDNITLKTIIEQARSIIISKGIELDGWQFSGV